MIDVLLIGILPLAVGGMMYADLVRRHGMLQRLWRDTAQRAGLTDISMGAAFRLSDVTGRAGEQWVRLSSFRRNENNQQVSGTSIAIAVDSGLTLRPEEPADVESSIFGTREIEIGDEAFDDGVWVLGAPEVVRAILDAETRKELGALLGGVIHVTGGASTRSCSGWVAVEDGLLRAWIRGNLDGGNQPETLAGALKTLLAMARKLRRPADVVGRIAENTLREPLAEVRVQSLRLLSESFPRHPRTREALRQGCDDENEEVQLVAALALAGEDGTRTLMEIATREWSSDGCAARAVTGLDAALSHERLQPILAHALRTRRMRTAEACLEALGRAGGAAMVEPVAKVLAIEAGALGVAAARALGASRAEGAEGPLLRALARSAPAVREAAAAALGQVGTAHAILSLKEVAASSVASGSLRRAARQAAGEIQSRLQGVAAPGQLSLAGGETGQLSLARADSGQLSLAAEADRRGQVSISEPRRKPE